MVGEARKFCNNFIKRFVTSFNIAQYLSITPKLTRQTIIKDLCWLAVKLCPHFPAHKNCVVYCWLANTMAMING